MPTTNPSAMVTAGTPGLVAQPNAETLAKISDLIEDGSLDVTVSSVRPLPEAQAAHEQVEEGHTRGKSVLKVVD